MRWGLYNIIKPSKMHVRDWVGVWDMPRFASAVWLCGSVTILCYILHYNKSSLASKVMFFISSVLAYTTKSSRRLTCNNAVYSWPWLKTGWVASILILSRVKPWQLLKVVAYAGVSGNWRRFKVCWVFNVTSNVMWGMAKYSGMMNTCPVYMSLLLCCTISDWDKLVIPEIEWMSCSVISRHPIWVIRMQAFLMRPWSMEKLCMSLYTHPSFINRLWGGKPGGVCLTI